MDVFETTQLKGSLKYATASELFRSTPRIYSVSNLIM
jgi:hypothetical protein